MSFNYALTANQQTPTSDSKVVLCKSFKIDIAAGSGFTTATSYTLGWLPKDAQVVGGNLITTTSVSGGTVSAATIQVTVGGNVVMNNLNVYATGYSGTLSSALINTQTASADQVIVYTPTLTGAGATAGVMYVTLQYVI